MIMFYPALYGIGLGEKAIQLRYFKGIQDMYEEGITSI